MTRPVAVLAGLGALLLALTLAATLLFWPVGVRMDPERRMDVLVALLFAGVLVYYAAVRLVLRHPPGRGALAIVLGTAALMRLLLLAAPPILSSDVYRYVWDGTVQRAGINPYRYVPADPALAPLRDGAVYPLVNRKDYARTIYPPAAQVVFAAVGRLDPTVTGMKAAMLLFEALGVACTMRLLRLAGLPRERVLVYAWNPLAVWAFACDGHVDALAVGFLGAALLLRGSRRDGLAGVALAGAALSKFIPVAVAPAFVRGAGLWRPALAGALAVAALYGLYASAGRDVLGFLGGYGSEEGLAAGGGFWLLAGLAHVTALPGWASAAYVATVAAAYAALSACIVRGRTSPDGDVARLCRDTAVLAAFATGAVSPHYAWYLPWMALPCAVAPVPAVIWLSSASVLFYVDPFHDRFIWPSLVYGPALLIAAASLLRRPPLVMRRPAAPATAR